VTLFAEQWTPQATALYQLLILTFSTNSESFADLPALQRSAGLSDNEWEDLMQYTTQVSRTLRFSTTFLIPCNLDVEQPRKLQNLRVHENNTSGLSR
jgi:dipeptidyl-peptidase-3